jgi:hypothetical protein
MMTTNIRCEEKMRWKRGDEETMWKRVKKR